jgi:excisionase family DNA binding protein
VTTVERTRLLTILEAAEKCAVSVSTIKRRINEGQLPAYRVGGPGSPLRIDERELDDFVFGWRQP